MLEPESTFTPKINSKKVFDLLDSSRKFGDRSPDVFASVHRTPAFSKAGLNMMQPTSPTTGPRETAFSRLGRRNIVVLKPLQ